MIHSLVPSTLKGIAGEIDFSNWLKFLSSRHTIKFIHNMPIPKHDIFTQADFVLLSEYGFFCIEVKNWAGEVCCRDGRFWEIYYSKKFVVPNPTLQNAMHTKYLKAATGLNFQNIVMFPDSTVLNDAADNVMNYSDLLKWMDSMPQIYTPYLVNKSFEGMLELKQKNELARLAYIVKDRLGT